jgi:hypothetical protein
VTKCAPNGAGRRLHGLPSRNYAELLHQVKVIEIRPDFDGFATRPAGRGDAWGRRLFPGRGNAGQRALVRAACGPVHNGLIPFGELGCDGEAQVGERREIASRYCL